MKKKITLQDIAKVAKVSTATASRVFSGNPTVAPAIRNQVRKAAEKLGVNFEERRQGNSKIIAFLLANRDTLNNFQARVLLGAEGYCSQQSWELLFMSIHYPPEIPPDGLQLPQLLSNRTNARAVILSGDHSPNLFAALNARGIPFSVLGNNVTGELTPQNYDITYSDDINGIYEATQHLIEQGHRLIGLVGNMQLPWCQRCSKGYLRAMAEAGLEPICADFRSDASQLGYLATKSLFLGGGRVPTAVLAGSDQVADGIYTALHELRLSIPGDVSVIGFNDSQGALLSPPLTTVREFPEEIGRHLAQFALGRLKDPSAPSQEITIPTQLVHRNSVAGPNPKRNNRASAAMLAESAVQPVAVG